MLKGISPYLNPDLLKTMHEMGHGDELLLADAHFPCHTLARRLLRTDGLTVPQMLDAILPLLELDQHSAPLIMMQPEPDDFLDPMIEAVFSAWYIDTLPLRRCLCVLDGRLFMTGPGLATPSS